MGAENSTLAHGRSPTSDLRLLIAAGGTGGHIFPALAVAEVLRARARERGGENCEIQFLGTGRELEPRLILGAGFTLHTIAAAGLKGIGGWRRIRNLFVLPRSAFQAGSLLRSFRPHVVVGTGGYFSGPVMLLAALRGIPTLLIEPNVAPGFTNRVLAPFIAKAAVGFEETARFFGPKARVTGHPVRKAFFSVPPKTHAPPFVVLVLGGSQGSRAINDCMVKSLPLLFKKAGHLRLVHQTGERDYNAVEASYREQGAMVEACPFVEDVPAAFARADLVVSRAGAMTVAELAAAGKASLLVPFAAAADSHQLGNARALERVGAARVVEQAELSPERLAKEVGELLGRPERLAEMERRARSLARPDAAERIADLIESLALSRQPLKQLDSAMR